MHADALWSAGLFVEAHAEFSDVDANALNGAGMLFGHLLTNTAQIFADLRTYWSTEAIQTASGKSFMDCARSHSK